MFLLFAPILPFAIFILVSGVGFILIAPTAIFIFSTSRLWQLYKTLENKKLAMTLGIAVFLIAPAYLVGEAFYYRAQLMRGLDYIESPDTKNPRVFNFDASKVVLAADWMHDYKSGRYLPFITPLRMEILCDGMVLPDSKLERIYELFSGAKFSKEKSDSLLKHMAFNNAKGTRFQQGLAGAGNYKDLDILASEISKESDGRFKLMLRITTEALENREFWRQMILPEGVFISDMFFKMNGERKRANIFEKKAALWTYENIVNERRDPAIVYYNNDGAVNVRAFPVNRNLATEIELYFSVLPNVGAGKISFSNAADFSEPPLKLAFEKEEKDSIFVEAGEDFTLVNFKKSDIVQDMFFTRKPYFSVILDMSENGFNFNEISEMLKKLSKANPDIKRAKIYLSNLNFKPAKTELTFLENAEIKNLDKLQEELTDFQRVGGFDYQNSLLFSMADYANSDMQEFPITVFLSKKDLPKDLENPFANLIRETKSKFPMFLMKKDLGELELDSTKYFNSDIKMCIASFANGNQRVPIWFDDSYVALFSDASGDEINVLDSGGEVLKFPVLNAKNSTELENIAKLYSSWIKLAENPSLKENEFGKIVELSKKINVLCPLTSMIVVETLSQENIMKLAEKKALAANKNLTFNETDNSNVRNMPEPAFIVSLLFGALALFAVSRLKKVAKF